jgi:hypothetical protein
MRIRRALLRFFLGVTLVGQARATAIVGCAASDGVALVVDSHELTVREQASSSVQRTRKFAVLRNRVAVASAGVGSFVLGDDFRSQDEFSYDFQAWMQKIDAALPPGEISPAAVAEQISRLAPAQFSPIAELMGLGGRIPRLYFVVVGYDGATPSLYEISVTRSQGAPPELAVTAERFVPKTAREPVIKAEGLSAGANGGPAAREARKRASLSSKSTLDISRLTLLAGWLVTIEARTNPMVSAPLDQVVIRPDGASIGVWRGK